MRERLRDGVFERTVKLTADLLELVVDIAWTTTSAETRKQCVAWLVANDYQHLLKKD